MTQQANPFNAMGRSFNVLQGAWDQGTRNQAGRAYAGGDVAGAANAFAEGGMLPEAQTFGRQARQGQMADSLRGGDYKGAASFAQSPEELATISQFRQSATEQERTAKAALAGQIAAVAEAVMSLPPDQQRPAALRYAEQFGLDPAQIPQTIDRPWLEGIRVQALGLEEYLKFKDREADNLRPIITPFGFYNPQGAQPPATGATPAPRSLGPSIPQGWSTDPPRPNRPPSAPAAGGGERSQTPRVSFQSSNEARQSVSRLVPGVQVTNADRTPADTARIRAQGYRPSDTSFHLRGQALDMVPPAGMSMAELAVKMRQAGFRVLDEGNHVHVSW